MPLSKPRSLITRRRLPPLPMTPLPPGRPVPAPRPPGALGIIVEFFSCLDDAVRLSVQEHEADGLRIFTRGPRVGLLSLNGMFIEATRDTAAGRGDLLIAHLQPGELPSDSPVIVRDHTSYSGMDGKALMHIALFEGCYAAWKRGEPLC